MTLVIWNNREEPTDIRVRQFNGINRAKDMVFHACRQGFCNSAYLAHVNHGRTWVELWHCGHRLVRHSGEFAKELLKELLS